MRHFDSGFTAALQATRESGIAPVHFVWVVARDRETGAATPMGLWSGDYDLEVSVPLADGTGVVSRSYIGGCGLRVSGLKYVGDLTDSPVTVSLSQIADAAQYLVRGLDVRLAYCEIHATSMTGGSFVSAPQLQWVGIVDDGPISTPAAGGEGGVALSIRSELMAMLTATNPAKSSDAHQKRRRAGDRFSEYASTINSRKMDWYKE
ncbi:hypothetical protein [Paracoccus sulfuroxidans]|uniref:Uncharacterized protein n=1 Tax=Paracoccus sulfuroxidans TaxID=384678 RepID=A0A562NQF6_9RHOB|nr:hypothetical protein [Paracoccus sulfuroxidans]AZV00347.1 hypothetical protein psul1_p39 [Paracoccus phage vB_PsuS_Psul1]TWI34300.1 hypothetical protein IQ24_01815 [Paracoccus sulfuroxidans]